MTAPKIPRSEIFLCKLKACQRVAGLRSLATTPLENGPSFHRIPVGLQNLRDSPRRYYLNGIVLESFPCSPRPFLQSFPRDR